MKTKLILLFLAASLSGCMKEYIYDTDMVYVNNSDYDIEVQHLNSDHFELREKISIPKHTEVIVYKTSTDAGYSLLEANTALVTYDHTVRITHRWNTAGEIPNSLRVLDSYVMIENSKKRYRRYTYTFTNADYEYAVAHNEMRAAEVAEYLTLLHITRGVAGRIFALPRKTGSSRKIGW